MSGEGRGSPRDCPTCLVGKIIKTTPLYSFHSLLFPSMNLGHQYHQASTGLVFDHLPHCWLCGSALQCLSTTWALYRCQSPQAHMWIRCPVHRCFAAVDNLSHIDVNKSRCLCQVDDILIEPFALLDRWTKDPTDPGQLVFVDRLLLHRSLIDLLLRGNLKRKDKDKRVFLYKTRPGGFGDGSLVAKSNLKLRSWFGLAEAGLASFYKKWNPNVSVTDLHLFLSKLPRENSSKRKRDPEDEVDELIQSMKRVRFVQGTKRKTEDMPSTRPLKRSKIQRIHCSAIENDRPMKRRRMEEVY